MPTCPIARPGRKGTRGPRSAGRESMGRRGVHERQRSQCNTVATSIWPTAVSQPGYVGAEPVMRPPKQGWSARSGWFRRRRPDGPALCNATIAGNSATVKPYSTTVWAGAAATSSAPVSGRASSRMPSGRSFDSPIPARNHARSQGRCHFIQIRGLAPRYCGEFVFKIVVPRDRIELSTPGFSVGQTDVRRCP